MNLTIMGPIPSKKNSRRCFFRSRKIINIPSSAYVIWHLEAAKRLKSKLSPIKTFKTVYNVDIFFYFSDKRRRDLTNVTESVMDLLVDCEILRDDCWQCVPRISLVASGIDKDNPRAEVFISGA